MQLAGYQAYLCEPCFGIGNQLLSVASFVKNMARAVKGGTR